MSEFNVGDRVIHNILGRAPKEGASQGDVMFYKDNGRVMVEWGGAGSRVRLDYPEENLTLVTAAETNNPTSPNVYKFPKAEVRDISAHLTSYGGQVVQYVARSTRLDGIFKDDRVQDLEKAKLMIQWEIERLQEAK